MHLYIYLSRIKMPFLESLKGFIWKIESFLTPNYRNQNGIDVALVTTYQEPKFVGKKNRKGVKFLLVQIYCKGHHYSRKKKFSLDQQLHVRCNCLSIKPPTPPVDVCELHVMSESASKVTQPFSNLQSLYVSPAIHLRTVYFPCHTPDRIPLGSPEILRYHLGPSGFGLQVPTVLHLFPLPSPT